MKNTICNGKYLSVTKPTKSETQKMLSYNSDNNPRKNLLIFPKASTFNMIDLSWRKIKGDLITIIIIIIKFAWYCFIWSNRKEQEKWWHYIKPSWRGMTLINEKKRGNSGILHYRESCQHSHQVSWAWH